MFKSVDQIVEEGSRSYGKGIGKAFNPYSPFRPSHWSWLSGWLQARSYALEKKIKKLEDSISALKAREDLLNRTIRDLSTTSALLKREVQGKTNKAVLIGPGDDDYGRKPGAFSSIKKGPSHSRSSRSDSSSSSCSSSSSSSCDSGYSSSCDSGGGGSCGGGD